MKDITPPLDNHKPASASSTSAVDRLKEQFAESGLLLSPRGRVIRDARLHGKTCAQCSRPFADGEAVCRLRLSHGRSPFGGTCNEIAPVCQPCFEEYVQYWRGIKRIGIFSTGQCENCGRTLHETELHFYKRHSYCCDDCQTKYGTKFYAERARQRRAEARGPSRSCIVCGECFEPKRNDAKYCSAACKQKAYRALRVAFGYHAYTNAIGNALEKGA